MILMQQHINLHTLGYSILANFSEWDIIERDMTLNENSVWLLIFQKSKNACEHSCNNRNLHTMLINFMRILSGAANL